MDRYHYSEAEVLPLRYYIYERTYALSNDPDKALEAMHEVVCRLNEDYLLHGDTGVNFQFMEKLIKECCSAMGAH